MKNWKILNNEKILNSPDEIIFQLLKNRGLEKKEEIDNFLNSKLEDITTEKVEIDKNELSKAIKRVKKAVKNNERIIIYGDYDVDGVCGTAILWETIYSFYKNVIPYIPHRVEEGYGLSVKGIENLKKEYEDIGLIITVDNGIVAYDAINFAKENNIDVIVTDHHVKGEKKLSAFSTIHTTSLSGAAVAFMFAAALEGKKVEDKKEHLDLVTLATVADMVSLTGCNRCFLKSGLDELKNTKRIGLIELFTEAGLDRKKIGVFEIGHIISPRLNASGRLSFAMDSLRLLCTKNKLKAVTYAQNLGKTNKERQLLTEETTIHAKSSIDKEIKNLLFVAHETYQPGVIGLVAGKLVEEHYRPSFVISIGEKYSKGSARSINGINIIEFIRSFSHLLVDAGGHAMAAGFTVETQKIEELKNEFEKKAAEIFQEELFKKTIVIDLLLNLENINIDLYKRIQELFPFGMGNFEPTFVSKEVVAKDIRLLGNSKQHVKFRLAQGNSKDLDGIAFYMADKVEELRLGDTIDIVYTIDENEWNGNKKLQLKIKDFK